MFGTLKQLHVVFVVIAVCCVRTGFAKDRPVESVDLDLPKMMTTSDGRIRLLGEDGKSLQSMDEDSKSLQTLVVWFENGLERLESFWDVKVPFRKGRPLIVRLDSEREAPELVEGWSDGQYVQTLFTPPLGEGLDPLVLADAFTRALALRISWQQRVLAGEEGPPEIPAWWVKGSSIRLLNGGLEGVMTQWFQEGHSQVTSYPDRLAVAFPADPDLAERGQGILMMRCVMQFGQEDRWLWLSSGAWETAAGWKDLLGAGDIRDYHQAWDLWREADRAALMSECRLASMAVSEMKDVRRVHPALIGVGGLPERYRPMTLQDLAQMPFTKGADQIMGPWILRLNRVGFRQNEDILEVIQTFSSAGTNLLTLLKSPKKNRSVTKALEEDLEQAMTGYHELLFKYSDESTSPDD